MKTLLAVSGSLRSESKNSKLLQHIKNEMKDKIEVTIFDAIAELPHFNPDLEQTEQKFVLKWRQALAQADAVLFSTPEYAHGIPGSLKNALDWVVGSGELMDKKTAVLFSSTSEAVHVQEQLIEVLKTMSADIKRESCMKISGATCTPEIELIIEKLFI